MENPNIILGLTVVILLGMFFVFLVRHIKNGTLPTVGRDALRKQLWEKGYELKEVSQLNAFQAFPKFGIAVIPNASYQNIYFLEVDTESDKGELKQFLVKVVLLFNKEVAEIEFK